MRIRRVSDGEKHPSCGKFLGLAGLDIFEPNARHAGSVIAQNFIDDRMFAKLDLRIRHRTLLHDLAGTQDIAPDCQVNLAAELRQKSRLLNRRVAAADDDERLVFGNEAVRRRTLRRPRHRDF